MAKTVFENSMVAHVWNAQTQSAGRSGNGNFYFNDSMLFSYRDSWCVAKIMDDGVVLINADTYSISTSRHTRYARHATSNRTRCYVPGLNELILRGDFNAQRVKKHLLENATQFGDDSARYLLKRIGEKNPATRWEKIKKERARLDLAEKESDAKSKLDSELRDASNVAAMDDSQANEYLARACNSGRIKQVSTTLYHAHRAAKKRKRNVQASRVYEVLTLARKIIKLDEVRARVKSRNRVFHESRNSLRVALINSVTRPANTSRFCDDIERNAERLAECLPVRMERAREYFALVASAAKAESERLYAIENAERIEKEKRDFESWLSGDRTARLPYSYYGATLLRALDVTRDESGVITGGTLQTSRNAEVPLVHAIRAFRFVKLCKENARTWTRNGHSLRVGHFTIDHVTATGDFTAGCHNITWLEVERVARLLGVFDCPASDNALTPSHEAA